jgi:transketolase
MLHVELPMTSPAPLDDRSRHLRSAVIDILAASRRGHVGSSFSIIEIVRVLYDHILHYTPSAPRDPARDRFILSKGHGCLALYVMLAEKGFFPATDLARFCALGAPLGGHPEYGQTPGIEVSTGSLGHGLSVGIGMALSARIDHRPYRVFVLMGDGECNEGSVWEAALSAGKHRLDSLTVLVDYNKMQSYGPTAEVQNLEPFADKWRSFGFAVAEVDGHDVPALRQLLQGPVRAGAPSAIICHTIKGKGIPMLERNPAWHHKTSLRDDELAALRRELAEGAP